MFVSIKLFPRHWLFKKLHKNAFLFTCTLILVMYKTWNLDFSINKINAPLSKI